LPEHTSTRVTFLGESFSASGMTGLELAVGEIVERRHRFLVAQQALRAHHDERLAVPAQHLPAQHVEHLRRRRGHAHLHVVLRAELAGSAPDAPTNARAPGPS
jgi:hypothetical protein